MKIIKQYGIDTVLVETNDRRISLQEWVTSTGVTTLTIPATRNPFVLVNTSGGDWTVNTINEIKINNSATNLTIGNNQSITLLFDFPTNSFNIVGRSESGGGGGGSSAWGGISGTLSNQTDLQNALNAKQNTLVAGTNISIDITDPLAPIISATGGGGSITTNYSVLTYASSINIDVSQTVNNKYIEASGNFAIVMTAKPALADGFWGDIHIKKTTASDITVTLDSLVSNANISSATALTTIVISGGLNIEEHIRFFYNKTTDKYYWEVLKYRTNHVKDITIIGGSYTLSVADFDFTKNDQMFFVATSPGQQDFIFPAGLAIPTGTNMILCQVSTTQLNVKKGNTSTVIFNPSGGVNSVGVQSTIYLASQNSMANITFKGSDIYYINGDILQ